jgi:demethylmenaquinone methyltransferase / 2-methoxy-6-polyprenyl-1,4-benzoquinol methylase
VCEFSRPPNPVVRFGFRQHLRYGLPLIAKVSSNPDAYTYLAESIQEWPDQATLAGRLLAAGWESVRWRDLSLGVVAVHHARVPGPDKPG